MGYFKKQVRRGKARDERRAFVEPARSIDPARWVLCTRRLLRPARDRYVRFVVLNPSGNTIGLFQSSELLRAQTDWPASAKSTCKATFAWFNRAFLVPKRLPATAVCWFRADAVELVERMRTLVELYRLAGYQVLMRTTAAPGRIVYRDEHQVAAVPYTDRHVTSNAV